MAHVEDTRTSSRGLVQGKIIIIITIIFYGCEQILCRSKLI